jgi:hypothetical protein
MCASVNERRSTPEESSSTSTSSSTLPEPRRGCTSRRGLKTLLMASSCP